MNGKTTRIAYRICLLGICSALIGCGGGGGGDGGGGSAPPPDSQPVADANSGPDFAPPYLATKTLQLNSPGTGAARIIRFDPNGTSWQEMSGGSAVASGTYLYQKNGAGQNALVTLNEPEGPVNVRLTFQSTSAGYYTYMTGRSGSASFTLTDNSGATGGNTTASTTGNTTGNTTSSSGGNTTSSTNGNTTGNTTGATDGTTSGNTTGNTTGTTNGSTTGTATTGNTTGSTSGSTTGSTSGESLSGLTLRGTRTFTSTGPVGQTHVYTFTGATFHDSDPPEESDGTYTYVTTGSNSASLHLLYTGPEDFAGDIHEMELQYTSDNSGTFTSTYRRHDGTNIQINGTFVFEGR